MRALNVPRGARLVYSSSLSFVSRLRKLGSLLLVFVAQCSAIDIHSLPDGGADASPDVALPPDTDGGTCGPLAVTNFAPPPMHPPSAPYAGACTAQQASDFAACEGGDTTKCAEFGPNQTAQACGACIVTHATDPTWGVVVFDGSLATVNVPGCVDDALAQVSWEKASGGNGSCGDLLHGWYACDDAACSACTGSDLTTCLDTADATSCSKLAAAAESDTGPCSALLGDAAPPAALACFPDPSITDPAAQRTDFLTRIAMYMCGPKP